MVVMRALLDRWRSLHEAAGYQEVSTPGLARDALYAASGHLDHYAENMFFTESEDVGDRYGLKPVNCPGTMAIFRSRPRSYRELPMRLSCYDLLHRRERSGVLTGLFRVQEFTQDDAHIFVTEDQIQAELSDLLALAERIYADFGLTFSLRLGGAPASKLGDDASWAKAEGILQDLLDARVGSENYEREVGEGAFYGPKVDFLVRDSLARDWQLGTFQLDFEMPRRLECRYVADDGNLHPTAVIHRALIGSFERFLGILLEHTDGHLPAYLSPVQVRVITVSSAHREIAERIVGTLRAAGIRADFLGTNERVGRQIRDALLARVPLVTVVGDKELTDQIVSLQAPGGRAVGRYPIEELPRAALEYCRSA
jgi:threonyl-tRNA synthetase